MRFDELVDDYARRAREAQAELRQLEQDVGRSATADGRYWLQRTALLEQLVATAGRAVATGDVAPLKHDLDALRGVTAPACNASDHQGR